MRFERIVLLRHGEVDKNSRDAKGESDVALNADGRALALLLADHAGWFEWCDALFFTATYPGRRCQETLAGLGERLNKTPIGIFSGQDLEQQATEVQAQKIVICYGATPLDELNQHLRLGMPVNIGAPREDGGLRDRLHGTIYDCEWSAAHQTMLGSFKTFPPASQGAPSSSSQSGARRPQHSGGARGKGR